MVPIPRAPRRSIPLLALVALLAACTTTPGASNGPSVAATAQPTAAPSAPAPSAGASASAAGQTDTAWGRIWDALPVTFPKYPGAQAATTGEGPASAVLQLPAQANVAADWTREALEALGWTIAASNGPLEDGSFVIEATHGGTCKAQISIAPTGGVTIATILVGSGCPFR